MNSPKSPRECTVFIAYFEHRIYSLEQRTVELDDLVALFQPFGNVSKVLIYDRALQVRAFIEFSEKVSLLTV